MRLFPRFRVLAAAATVAALLLTACGGTSAEESGPPAASADATGTLEPTPAPDSQPGLPSADTPAEAPEDPSPAPVPSSTRAVVVTGALEGENLNPAAIAWFDVLCSGAAEASSFSQRTEPGMGSEEVIAAAVSTYSKMGTSVAATADRMGALDTDMNFDNASVFAAEVQDIFTEVGQIFAAGAETVRTGTFRSEEEFGTTILEIERAAMEAGGYDFGISGLDPTITAAVSEQVPSCATV